MSRPSLASKSRKKCSAHWHMTLRPAIERAMLCLALARHWDCQSTLHRQAGPGRAAVAWSGWPGKDPGKRHLALTCAVLCQTASDPSLSHSRKRRSDCRWQWGPGSSIQTQAEARDDRRPKTRQGRLRNRGWRRATQLGRESSREQSKMERSRSSESARVLSRIHRPDSESTRTRTLSQAWVARVSQGLV